MRGLQSFRWPVKLALLVIALLAVIAIGSGWWLPWDPAAIDLQQRLLPPGAAHWLGTDHLGRDIFSRLLAATRVSLGAVMACLLLVLLIGLAVGGSAGLLGGRADRGLMRIAELFMTFPTSILSFFMVGVLGTGLTNVILAIALSHWAWYARMVRNLGGFPAPARIYPRRPSERRQPVAAVQRPSGRRGDPLAAGARLAGYRPYDASRSRHVVPRSRCQRTDGGMGGDDQRRPAVYLDPAAANGLAGAGAVHQRDGF